MKCQAPLSYTVIALVFREAASLQTFETLLALLAVCVGLALLARKLNAPTAVALVLGGMVLALIPGIPRIVLDPELTLALFLPPLLQASAQRTDWQAFRSNLVPIMLLAIGAVVVTAFVVGATARFLIPSLSWWPAIALGAIVAPPDAVAATSVLRAFRIPKRIVTVLEGESLVNDASSLVLYRFAVAATIAGTISLRHGTASFFLSAIGGGLIGAVMAFVVSWLLRRLEDATLEIIVSMLAGFGAFLIGERLHVSGVLAAVACGGILGRNQLQLSAKSRVEGQTTWQFVEFVLTSLLFILIGIQLRPVVAHLHGYTLLQLVMIAWAVSAALILSRIVIVFSTFYPVEELREAMRSGSLARPSATRPSFPGRVCVASLALRLRLRCPNSSPNVT